CFKLLIANTLGFKSWHHVIYVVIPFALLGYGIGANAYLLLKRRLQGANRARLLRCLLLAQSVSTIVVGQLIVFMPVNAFSSIFMAQLLPIYSLFCAPYVITGFILTMIFTELADRTTTLYFFDLIGAGIGALVYFGLINHS